MAAIAIDLQPYASLGDAECELRIVAAKETLDARLCMLGHHYQRDEICKHADFPSGPLKLSRQAAQPEAEYIIFCGVHFIAEVDDIITRSQQQVMLALRCSKCLISIFSGFTVQPEGSHGQ